MNSSRPHSPSSFLSPPSLLLNPHSSLLNPSGGILPNCLRAFEKSDLPEDWRDLMQPFLVRRTRESFAARNLFDSDATQQA